MLLVRKARLDMLRFIVRHLPTLAALSLCLPACSDDASSGVDPSPLPDSGTPDSESPVDAATTDAQGSDTQGTGTVNGSALLFGLSDHAGIQVVLEGTQLEAVTDASGKFVLASVPAGTHTLIASFAGYAPERREAVVVTADGKIELEPLTLHVGKLLRAGDDSVPLGFMGAADHALYFADFSPYLGTGTLWTARPSDLLQTRGGDSVAPPGVVPSPDGKRLAVLSNLELGTGFGDLSVVDVDTGVVHPLEKNVAVGTLGYTIDGAWLLYETNLDPMTQVGDLRLYDCGKAQDRLVASGVPFQSLQVSKDNKKLVYASEFSLTESLGDMYVLDLAGGKPALIDENVFVPLRWAPEDWSKILYLKGPMTGQSATLRMWDAAQGSAVTLGVAVPSDSVFPASDFGHVVFLSDYDEAAQRGALRVWKAAGGATDQIAAVVAWGINTTADGNRLLFTVDPDPVTQQGTLTAWDFPSGSSVPLGASGGAWKMAEKAPRLAHFETFDLTTSIGSLSVYDFATSQELPVANDASSNTLELDPLGRYVVFQRNPEAGTYMGDLWVHDFETDQSQLLAEHALPPVRFSADGSMLAFFTEPDTEFRTAQGFVWRRADHKLATLGRVSFLMDQLAFRDDGGLLTFYRNPSADGMRGDLWAWDPSKDAWTAPDPGMLLGTGAYTWGTRFRKDGLTFLHDLSELGDVADLAHWSVTTRKTTELGADLFLPSAVENLAGDKTLYAMGSAQPRGDLFLSDLTTLQTRQIGKAAHLGSLWLDPDWKRVVFLAEGSGDLGNLTVADLVAGTEQVIGKDVPFFAMRVSPKGSRVAFASAWDTKQSVGTLFVDDMTDPDPALPVDEPSPLTFMLSEQHLMYVVKASETPKNARNGIYLAPLP